MRITWKPLLLGAGTLVLTAVAPLSLAGQEVGLGATVFGSDTEDLPGGPGTLLWVAWSPATHARLQLSLAREWGSEPGRATTCTVYFPPTGCVEEAATRRNILTSGELVGTLMSPTAAGFRLGIGAGIGAYSFDVSLRGEETDRVHAPIAGRAGDAHPRLYAPTYLALLEFRPSPGSRAGVTLTAQRFEVEFEGCVADAWGLCGVEAFDRLALSVGYEVR